MLSLGLLLSPPDLVACSIGSGVLEQDLPQVVRQSDQVFVANLAGYSQFVPFGARYHMGRMEYVVLETIKGDPATRGVLFESTGLPAIVGIPPAPCGPRVVAPGNTGGTYLVFVTRYPDAIGPMPHPLSIRLDPSTPASARLLDFVRTLPQHDSTP